MHPVGIYDEVVFGKFHLAGTFSSDRVLWMPDALPCPTAAAMAADMAEPGIHRVSFPHYGQVYGKSVFIHGWTIRIGNVRWAVVSQ